MESTQFCPEMNQTPNRDQLFHCQHNFRNSQSLTWLESRDAEAREALRRHRVRPAFKTEFRVEETGPGRSGHGMWPGQRIVHCLITSGAEDKLWNAGLICRETLLD